MTQTVTSEQKKRFRTIGHNLKPVVMIAGNGLTENVLEELERALNDHELIKVKLAVGDRDVKKEAIAKILKKSGAALVQSIGHVILIYRAAKKPNAKLSNVVQ